jgi:hypothetical protein
MAVSPDDRVAAGLTRRAFLQGGVVGLGTLALASFLDPLAFGTTPRTSSDRWDGVVDPPHVVPRARRVIQLYMAGGPSHLESFDHKPKLAAMDRQPMPDSITSGQPIAQLQNSKLVCMAPQFPFGRFGASGQEISTLFPHTAEIADEICIIRSMQTDQINHAPAHVFMNTGSQTPGRPSMGSWVVYALGSETDDLPAFVVMVTSSPTSIQPISSSIWQNGFLSSRFQGVKFQSKGSAVDYLVTPDGVDAAGQRDVIDAVRRLDEAAIDARRDPEIAARISQYETAARMQTSIPELTDVSNEPKSVLDLYGIDGHQGGFAANCLMARRLIERGVRFVQLCHNGWDHHAGIRKNMEILARDTDRGCGALVRDLRQRGLLDDTLVVWGGEFGRTPMAQLDGRDHHIRGFTMWMAGGGVRRGLTYGATDDFGYFAVENPVHVHDFHATALYLLGIDHKRLTFRYRGRDFRLTDEAGEVVHGLIV